MTDPVGTHFGLVIAYVLPGFATLWGLRLLSTDIQGWFSPSSGGFANLDVVLFVTLASIAAGMIVSAVRWLTVDTLHVITGLKRPAWDDSLLQDRLQAFEAVVQAHYQHYLFYANTAVAIAFVFVVWCWQTPTEPRLRSAVAFLMIEFVMLATSRDTLRKYYARGSRILDPHSQQERRIDMANGHGPKPSPKPPVTTTKSSSKKK